MYIFVKRRRFSQTRNGDIDNFVAIFIAAVERSLINLFPVVDRTKLARKSQGPDIINLQLLLPY